MTSAFSWQNSISLCPASFHIPRPNLPVTPGVSWLPTFAFKNTPIPPNLVSCLLLNTYRILYKPLLIDYSVLYLYLQYIYLHKCVCKGFLKARMPDSFNLGTYNGNSVVTHNRLHTIGTQCTGWNSKWHLPNIQRVPRVCIDIKAAQKEGHVIKTELTREFPGGPVVRILHFHCWGQGLSPGRGNKDPKNHVAKKKKNGGRGKKDPIFLSCS